jgi:hypothetical protein
MPAPLAIALLLSACAVYQPPPAYPAHGYAYSPGYAYAPGPVYYFRYDERRYRHHHWRG